MMTTLNRRPFLLILSALLVCLLLSGCRLGPTGSHAAEAVTAHNETPTPLKTDQTPTATWTLALATPPSPTPTPTMTRTAQPSATPTATATRTMLPSATPTPTPSPTATWTAQPTLTPTATPPLLSRSFVVGIDPGHGGRDLGARHFGPDGRMVFYESQVVLDIALRLARLLEERGHGVVLTRDGDYYLNDEDKLDINEDGVVNRLDQLQLRADIVNAAEADLLISIHLNAYEGEGSEEVGGTATYYCAVREFSDKSLRFAQLVQEHTLAALADLGYESRDRGVRTDLEAGTFGQHMILLGPKDDECVRPSQMPGALSESLFITNRHEAYLLQQEETLEALAHALLAAIEAYIAEVVALEPAS